MKVEDSFEGSADLPPDNETDIKLCPEGKYFSHQICLECSPGHFCPGNVSAPHRCPVGTFNPYTGRSSISDCKPCFPGLISSEDRVDCSLCPAGFTCDPTLGTLSLCPPGQHSPEGVLQCLTCPVDSICTSGFPLKCGPGKEPSADQTVCNECSPGFYSTMCTIQCLQCPEGSYCPDSGMSQPLPCPPGWSSTPAQTHCLSCNDTSSLCGEAVAPRCSQPVHRSSQTITCRPGTYKDTKEESACVGCPVGYYCVGGAAVPCPAGTYGPKEGLQRLTDCAICHAG
ncbi:signal peptide, CUB and EGF-like domain-containing protein 3 [Labrus mixtus]|uniref:signal peptide, CUB and EGF-like domain-containing protein 3 n=1 Tax=Labrus mixtus TaxID=508554 RepID=UPI0029C0A197|nr:signal peptide, CUB and EGF-like domain-containing protein 3 [Labrus mixtus]